MSAQSVPTPVSRVTPGVAAAMDCDLRELRSRLDVVQHLDCGSGEWKDEALEEISLPGVDTSLMRSGAGTRLIHFACVSLCFFHTRRITCDFTSLLASSS